MREKICSKAVLELFPCLRPSYVEEAFQYPLEGVSIDNTEGSPIKTVFTLGSGVY